MAGDVPGALTDIGTGDHAPADAAKVAAKDLAPAERLFTWPFVAILAMACLGFGIEVGLRTVLPLVILDRGGDAFAVGVLITAGTIPSLLFRPFIGRLIDTWRHDVILRVGALVLTAGAPLYIGGSLLVLGGARVFQGVGWAMYSVANHALMAKLAPPGRRGEASGYYMAMPAIATLVGPAVGVAVYLNAGEAPAIGLTFLLGIIASVIAFTVAISPRAEPTARRADETGPRPRVLERSSFPSTVMVTTFMSAQSLFIVFPPIFLTQAGAPLEILTIYYPIYGSAKAIGQLVVGRVSDRLGRIAPIITGCAIAIAGLAGFFFLDAVPGLFTASIAYALGMAFAGPAIGALAIDRAPEGRVGAAMATYTLGYQLATGVSGVLWGAIIAGFGYPWPFVAAAGMIAVTIAVGLRLSKDSRNQRS